MLKYKGPSDKEISDKLDDMCKKIQKSDYPAQNVVNTLTFNHWANGNFGCLRKKCPDVFSVRSESRHKKYKYYCKDGISEFETALAEFMIDYDKSQKKITTVQRKPISIFLTETNKRVCIIEVELYSVKYSKNKEWKVFIRVFSPRWELYITKKEKINITKILVKYLV
jgi:hypothetical protein